MIWISVAFAGLAMLFLLLWIQATFKWKEAARDLQVMARGPLTVEECAVRKRVSKSTIARLAREGKIPAEKVGRQWRISQGGE